MKAASIGFEFFDSRVESITFGSNRTPLNKDVILFSPAGFYREYGRDGLHSYDLLSGSRLSEWYVPDGNSGKLIRDIDRRQKQLDRALEIGKTLVVFVPEPDLFKVAREKLGGRDSVSVLLAVPFTLETEAAETSDLELRTGEPFASFWRAVKDRMSAAAVITEGSANVCLTIMGTDAVVASYGECGKGIVLLLPGILHLSGIGDEEAETGVVVEHADHIEFMDALFELVRALRRGGHAKLPEWSEAIKLPGERAQTAAIRRARKASERAQAKLAEQEKVMRDLQARKLLFTGSGGALEAQVASALRALGFTVERGPPARSDLVCIYAGTNLVVEVKGLTKSAGEKNSAQLERWVSDYYSEHDQHPKPMLVVNGWREKSLAERQPVFPAAMLDYAERREHALVTGVQLLSAWLDVEARPGKRDDIVGSLLGCVGVWDRYRQPDAMLELVDIR